MMQRNYHGIAHTYKFFRVEQLFKAFQIFRKSVLVASAICNYIMCKALDMGYIRSFEPVYLVIPTTYEVRDTDVALREYKLCAVIYLYPLFYKFSRYRVVVLIADE